MTTKAVPDPEIDAAPKADGEIKWMAAPLTARGIVALLVNAANADTLYWGDGTHSAATGGALHHTYAAARAYTVTAKQGETVVAQTQVSIRDGLMPTVTFAPASDNPNIIEATFNDDPADLISKYQVTWAPDDVEEVVAAKGTKLKHAFRAGTHTIAIRDLHTSRGLSEDVDVKDKEYDPDFSITKGADVNTAELEITRLVTTGKDLLVDWGDYKQTTITAAQAAVGFKVSHPYETAGDYIIQLVYSDGSTDGSARLVTIPFAAARG